MEWKCILRINFSMNVRVRILFLGKFDKSVCLMIWIHGNSFLKLWYNLLKYPYYVKHMSPQFSLYFFFAKHRIIKLTDLIILIYHTPIHPCLCTVTHRIRITWALLSSNWIIHLEYYKCVICSKTCVKARRTRGT